MTVDDDNANRLRLQMFAFVALILFGALFTRLWYLQGIESEDLAAEAETNVLREIFEEAPRGRILDRDGRVLVDNTVVDVVTIDKSAIADLDADAQQLMFYRLAVAISRSGRLTKVESIANEVASGEYRQFDEVPVAIDVDANLLVYIGERPDQFPGVDIVSRTVRSYPYGTLAAHLLGYVGAITASELEAANARVDSEVGDAAKIYQLSDEIGKTGVERVFENVLRGVPGVRYLEVDNRGEVIGERTDFSREPVPGADLYLTIDIDLQALAEQELADGLERARDAGHEAPAGALVATEPTTGGLLAMASFPTYRPGDFVNGFSQAQFELLTSPENDQPILNRAIQEAYAPGSTFKPVTALAALEAGYLDPGSRIVEARNGRIEDRGVYTLPQCRDDFEAADTCEFSSPRAGLAAVTFNLAEALTYSSDVFFYKLAAEGFYPEPVLGPEGDEAIQAMARQFGLGTTTAIQLPYETSGVIPDRDYFDLKAEEGVFLRDGSQWFPGDTVLLSIGQGETAVTPVQLANLYATIANGGRLLQINVASRTETPDGEVLNEFGPRELRQLELAPGDMRRIEDGLLGVPTVGTARSAFEGFPVGIWPVAAKTGTAQVRDKEDTSLFAAYGPVLPGRDPEIAIAVVLEEAGFGSEAAAPIASAILEALATDTLPEARTVEQADRAAQTDPDGEESEDLVGEAVGSE